MRASVALLCSFIVIIPVARFAAAQASFSGSVKILASFDAVAGSPDMSYKDHPDLALAACSKCGTRGQVLVATGQDIAIYDSKGAVLKTQSTRDFIKAAGLDPDEWRAKPALPPQVAGKVNDPRAAFDPFIGRWIVVCSCSADYLIVSGGKDATGPWKGAVLTGAAGDLTMFPGWDKNGVYVSEFQERLNSQYIALPSADVAWSGTGNISLDHETHIQGRPYEMRPAIDPNPNKGPGDPEYFVARSGPPQNATNVAVYLLVDKVTWSGNAASVSGPASVSSGFLYNTPIAVPQPAGPDIRGNESHRVFSVYQNSGHLYLVEASGPCRSSCGDQGQDANDLFFWFELDPVTMTITQKAKVSSPTMAYLFPTLALDGEGNTGIGVNGGSKTQPMSVYLFTHTRGSAAGSFHGPVLAEAGIESYSCKLNPVGWGTYSATIQDGSDPMKLWTLQEYAGSSTPCVWKTRVIAFRVEGQAGTKTRARKRR